MRLRVRSINLTLPRRIDGTVVRVPVIAGLKAGLSGEKFLIDLLRALSPHVAGAFVDVGANIGQTLARLRIADADRPYYGFEPNPACFHYLERFIEVNSWMNVTLFPFGIGERPSIMSMHTAVGKATDLTASFVPDSRVKDEDITYKHAAVFDYATVAPFIREPIAILKVDVECMELEVLRSFRSAIERDRPVIVTEMLTLERHRERHVQTVELLRGSDYRVFLIESNRRHRLTGLREIHAYEDVDAPHKADYVALNDRHVGVLDPTLLR